MSEFACQVLPVKIVPHENADQIEIALVGGFRSIVKKGQLKDGDLAVYLPEQAIVPEWLMKRMGFWDDFGQRGMLHGAGRNRIKAIKLRGVVSQGIVLAGSIRADGTGIRLGVENDSGIDFFAEGQCVAEYVGITKFEPALPSHMAGKAIGVDLEATHNYDFDNIKRNPTMFSDGDQVVITEKIHGTFLSVCVVPDSGTNERYWKGRVAMTSKGLGGKGIILDHNDIANLYAQTCAKWDLMDKVLAVLGPTANETGKPVFLFGEVFGKTLSNAGVQDLTYTNEQVDYRAFDICVGNRGNENFFSYPEFVHLCALMGVQSAPVLHIGPFSQSVLEQHTNGDTTLTAPNSTPHIREGCVVKSYEEVATLGQSRRIAKSVSDAYLLRKGDTSEFN